MSTSKYHSDINIKKEDDVIYHTFAMFSGNCLNIEKIIIIIIVQI